LTTDATKPIPDTATVVEQATPTKHSLNEILLCYGVSQFLCALVGSFGITPSVAASNTMYTVSHLGRSAKGPVGECCILTLLLLIQLKAENVAPQLGSIILLTVFYLTDFQLISCKLVLRNSSAYS